MGLEALLRVTDSASPSLLLFFHEWIIAHIDHLWGDGGLDATTCPGMGLLPFSCSRDRNTGNGATSSFKFLALTWLIYRFTKVVEREQIFLRDTASRKLGF